MKQHPKYSRYYMDDNLNVYGPRKKLTPTRHNTGYLVYSVFDDDKKQHQERVHRFIWECDTQQLIPEGMQINHIDGNKQNNSLDNLELCTAKENAVHRDESGLRCIIYGSDHSNSKIDHSEVFGLFRDILNGYSNGEIGSKYNLHPRYVSLIRHKHRRKKEWQLFESSETIRKEYGESSPEAAGTER